MVILHIMMIFSLALEVVSVCVARLTLYSMEPAYFMFLLIPSISRSCFTTLAGILFVCMMAKVVGSDAMIQYMGNDLIPILSKAFIHALSLAS